MGGSIKPQSGRYLVKLARGHRAWLGEVLFDPSMACPGWSSLQKDWFLWRALRCSTKSGGGRLEKRKPDEAFFIPSTDHLNATIKGDKKSVEFIALSYRWISAGEQYFLAGASGREPAQAIHRRLIECIHDLASPAESNAEMLNVEGVPA